MDYEDISPVCIIPARGKSPYLPKKNIKPIDGKPLVAHSVETAVETPILTHVFVSTESDRIAQIAESYGARVPFIRPVELTSREATLRPVIEHALKQIKKTVDDVTITPTTPIVILQPNVPFRQKEDIDEAVSKFIQSEDQSIVSVTKENGFFWRETDEGLSPTFSIERRLNNNSVQTLKEGGSITVTSPRAVRAHEWPGKSPGYVISDRLSAFKIDTLIDFWLAEKIAKGPMVVFRTEGGGNLGLGKVYRAVTIAAEIRKIFECDITFITKESYRAGVSLIQAHGFDFKTITSVDEDLDIVQDLDPDIVVVDVEGTEERYHHQLHQLSAAVVDFESFYDGEEPADFVVNPQRHMDGFGEDNYLNGPDYLVLRDEFLKESPEITEVAKNILLTFGGTDPLGLTIDCIEALGRTNHQYNYRVVLGPGFNQEDELQSLPDSILSKFEFRRNVESMGKLMQWADIAVTSGGRTVYELAATGTPSIVIAQNDGEIGRMKLLRDHDAIEFLGHGETVDFDQLPTFIDELSQDYERRAFLSKRGRGLVDGNGLQRIIATIERMFVGT
jgi:spore coat polysaccharide biosynthesis predicted glycosyltransferase SpsG/CMP-N-acetylneuraminic acid synthetase